MKLHYYGTAAAEGWPALFCNCPACRKARRLGGKNIRTRAQAVVENHILLDFGPDAFLHAVRDGMPLHELHHCLITHGHADHFYPSDLVMKAPPYADNGRELPLHLYGSGWVHRLYERAREIDDDTRTLDECVLFHEIKAFEPFPVQDYDVTALAASHNPPEPCFLYLIRDGEGKTLLYAHDTGWFPEATWDHLKNVRLDLVSLDCTMGWQTDGSTHLGYEGCVKTKRRLKESGAADEGTQFVLNHFSHNLGAGKTHEEMEALAAKDGFQVAWDGFEIETKP